MTENIVTKDMLNLFDAISGDIWLYGKRMPEICAAIRKRIEQASEQADAVLIQQLKQIARESRKRGDPGRAGAVEKAIGLLQRQSKRTVTMAECGSIAWEISQVFPTHSVSSENWLIVVRIACGKLGIEVEK